MYNTSEEFYKFYKKHKNHNIDRYKENVNLRLYWWCENCKESMELRLYDYNKDINLRIYEQELIDSRNEKLQRFNKRKKELLEQRSKANDTGPIVRYTIYLNGIKIG